MALFLTTASENAVTDHLASIATILSLHSADPGTTGANETSAGRQTVVWPAAANGDTAVTDVAFTGGAANGPVTHVGLWSPDGLTFRGSWDVPTGGTHDLAFNAAGEYVVTSATLTGGVV